MSKRINKFDEFKINESSFCTKVCKECPFSKNSIPGWLADYTVEDFSNFMNGEALFPCHMLMSDDDLNQQEVQEQIESGELKLCRGYVESIIKSCKSPRGNQILKDAIAKVKEEGLSQETMPIWEFREHHSKFKK